MLVEIIIMSIKIDILVIVSSVILILKALTDSSGPAMTWGIFSIGWLDLNNEVKASELFTRSYFPYVRKPFKVRAISLSELSNSKEFIVSKGAFTE